MVVGHGPHLPRGLERHRGTPNYYGPGKFFGQSEVVQRLPANSYHHVLVVPSRTPADVERIRSEDGRTGFPAERRYWETLAPLIRFADGAVGAVGLHQVSLGHGDPPHRRGRPRLADGAEGTAILERVAALSTPDGTRLDIGDGRALVRMDGGPGRESYPSPPGRLVGRRR